MNLSYQTQLPQFPAYPKKALALEALTAGSPFSAYNQNHEDVMAGLGGANAAQFDIEATKASTDQQLRQQRAEQQLVLQGLQQMNDAQQNENSLASNRLQNSSSMLSGLIRSLYS